MPRHELGRSAHSGTTAGRARASRSAAAAVIDACPGDVNRDRWKHRPKCDRALPICDSRHFDSIAYPIVVAAVSRLFLAPEATRLTAAKNHCRHSMHCASSRSSLGCAALLRTIHFLAAYSPATNPGTSDVSIQLLPHGYRRYRVSAGYSVPSSYVGTMPPRVRRWPPEYACAIPWRLDPSLLVTRQLARGNRPTAAAYAPAKSQARSPNVRRRATGCTLSRSSASPGARRRVATSRSPT